MTAQQRMKVALESLDIPKKTVEVYGSQIVITAWSEDAAKKWASVLSKFATFRGITHSLDYNKVNTNSVMLPSAHEVWRAFARID